MTSQDSGSASVSFIFYRYSSKPVQQCAQALSGPFPQLILPNVIERHTAEFTDVDRFSGLNLHTAQVIDFPFVFVYTVTERRIA